MWMYHNAFPSWCHTGSDHGLNRYSPAIMDHCSCWSGCALVTCSPCSSVVAPLTSSVSLSLSASLLPCSWLLWGCWCGRGPAAMGALHLVLLGSTPGGVHTWQYTCTAAATADGLAWELFLTSASCLALLGCKQRQQHPVQTCAHSGMVPSRAPKQQSCPGAHPPAWATWCKMHAACTSDRATNLRNQTSTSVCVCTTIAAEKPRTVWITAECPVSAPALPKQTHLHVAQHVFQVLALHNDVSATECAIV